MHKLALTAVALSLACLSVDASAKVATKQHPKPAVSANAFAVPAGFKTKLVHADGADIFVRHGGSGPAVLLIHGFGDTGDMWNALAEKLSKTHTVIVPDLRGMGLSSHPKGGYDKKTQAGDMRAVLTDLGVDHAQVVGHDIGNMVAYAYAKAYPDKTDTLTVMDAPVPGIPPWNEVIKNPLLWHFNFYGVDEERLVAGRERIFLDRFYNEFGGDPARITEATRQHYAKLYAMPGTMHSSFEQFHAFSQDAKDNLASLDTKLTMPVLAIGAAKSFGSVQAASMRNAATNVTEAVIPDSGHWIMDENPAFAIKMLTDFLK
jgi:pimeloyl-ACP methyl ester carboxylesterase